MPVDVSVWITIHAVTVGVAIACCVAIALIMYRASEARISDAQMKWRDREAAMLARIDLLERQLMEMWMWARNQQHPPKDIQHYTDAALIYALRTLYTHEELEQVAHDIGIRLGDVGGETISGIAHRLYDYAQERGLLDALIAVVRRTRPNAGV
jgi:MFS superfamily sulfate permease-like transporter